MKSIMFETDKKLNGGELLDPDEWTQDHALPQIISGIKISNVNRGFNNTTLTSPRVENPQQDMQGNYDEAHSY